VSDVHARSTGGSAGQSPALRRTLVTWGAIGLSVAAMGASLAANINPQGSALTVGRAVPLTFVLATIGVVLVAYGFARVCSRLSHAGSVFALTGTTIGPRSGVVAGWSLLGAYIAFVVTTAITAGIFGTNFLVAIGVWHTAPLILPWILALVAIAGCIVMAIFPVKRSTSLLLWVEVGTALLILVISVVVIIRVVTGNSPVHTHFTLNMFTVPHGVGISSLFLGVVFGFLSFAGFEAAATLGEEAIEPKRAIPRAIFAVAIVGGLFYVFTTATEMLGFGTTAAGVKAFSGSTSLFGTLGSRYIAGFVGDVVTLGTTVAAIGCCLATIIGASRILFAMTRGGLADSRLARLSPRSGVPGPAAAAVGGVAAISMVIVRLAFTHNAFDIFAWSGTTGTLVLLVAYAMFTAGAWYYLVVRGPRQGLAPRRLDYIVPVLALMVVGYTLYRNVIPWPSTGSGRTIVLLDAAWVLVAIVGIICAPRVTTRIASRFAEDEGLSVASSTATEVLRPSDPVPSPSPVSTA
jgi:amino acid transporter